MIGGNKTATIQIKSGQKNSIGEKIYNWNDELKHIGYLDYVSGQNNMSEFKGKIQDTTHLFICDYFDLKSVTSENSRMVVDNEIYQILMIDNPMGLNDHYEFYLKYVGGGLNG